MSACLKPSLPRLQVQFFSPRISKDASEKKELNPRDARKTNHHLFTTFCGHRPDASQLRIRPFAQIFDDVGFPFRVLPRKNTSLSERQGCARVQIPREVYPRQLSKDTPRFVLWGPSYWKTSCSPPPSLSGGIVGVIQTCVGRAKISPPPFSREVRREISIEISKNGLSSPFLCRKGFFGKHRSLWTLQEGIFGNIDPFELCRKGFFFFANLDPFELCRKGFSEKHRSFWTLQERIFWKTYIPLNFAGKDSFLPT